MFLSYNIAESFRENFTSLTPNSIIQFVVRYRDSRMAALTVGITLVMNFSEVGVAPMSSARRYSAT